MKKSIKGIKYMTTMKSPKMAPHFHNGFGKVTRLGHWNHLTQMNKHYKRDPQWFEFKKTIKVFGHEVIVFYDRDGILVWRFTNESA